jgi:hypothetical protein
MRRKNRSVGRGFYLGIFADDACIYARDLKQGYILRKLQRGLIGIKTWCERWDITINEDEIQAPSGSSQIQWRNITCVNHVKYLGAIFDKRNGDCIQILWRIDPLLGNGSVNTFQQTRSQQNKNCAFSGPCCGRCYAALNEHFSTKMDAFLCYGSASSLYK